MRTMILLTLCVLNLACFGQEAVSTTSDKVVTKKTDKVRTAEKPKPGLTINYKPGDKAHEKEVFDFVKRYYKAYLEGDLVFLYNAMSKQYRDTVNMRSYLTKKQIVSKTLIVDDIRYEGDSCALVVGTQSGASDSRLSGMTLPLKLRLFKEDGKWVIFSNPYQMMGFMGPKGKDFVYPCTELK